MMTFLFQSFSENSETLVYIVANLLMFGVSSASVLHPSRGAVMGEQKPGLSDTGSHSPSTLHPNRTNDGF